MKSHYRYFLVSIAICLILDSVSAKNVIQDLGGNDWTVKSSTGFNQEPEHELRGQVPGSIYTDLRNAGVITEDIYKDFNDVNYRWVSYLNWTYEKYFDLDPEVSKHQQVYLIAHGLDTIGNVFLNGHFLGSVNNMFIRYKWNVKDILKSSNNNIRVDFFSAPVYALQYYMYTMKNSYVIPPVCTTKQQNGECHVNFLRKMQSSFSWDWGPAFPTQGIWQPIQLEAYDSVIVRSISVNTQLRSNGNWNLDTTVYFESEPLRKINVNLTLILDGLQIANQEFVVQSDLVGEGYLRVNTLHRSHTVRPWFPNGLGLQYLYNLTAEASVGSQTSTKSVRIGFRTIELVQSRLKSSREAYSFYFQVNGQPIYAKGSNWIPAHALHENITESYLRELLYSAKLANMNMLRVWGGGIYEDDKFYEIADEYGILIWQDMMFACALYPTDSKFLSSVSIEIKQQVRRLQHHPSIALWAGNNENEVAIATYWWPELALHLTNYILDYLKLYIDTMKPIVEHEDDSRPFLPSSPSNGIVSIKDNYLSSNPQDNRFGDVHHYIVMGDVWDWKLHPSAKFVSEYGFQSLSSLKTLKSYINETYLKFPLDSGLLHREHQVNGNIYLTSLMHDNLPMPNDTDASVQKLEDFIYLSQIFQAMAIKIQTEFYRRNRDYNDDGEGLTMGALYWQLNDIWPAFSWSSLEFGGKWKMLHYYISHIFDNVLVDVFEDEQDLKVVIVRDDHLPFDIPFYVDIEVFDWAKKSPLHTQQINCSSYPFNVTLVYQQNTTKLLHDAKCTSRNRCFIQVTAVGMFNNLLITRHNFLLLSKPKYAVGLVRPKISVSNLSGPYSTESDQYIFQFELSTDQIAPFVWLDFQPDSQITGIFSDNGFILTDKKNVTFRTSNSISKLQLNSNLVIKSLTDVNQH